MTAAASLTSELDEIAELNRLFLSHLRDRAGKGLDCLDLAPSAARLLTRVPGMRLESAALFPRALFRLHLRWADEPAPAEQGESSAPAAHALQLTLLMSAWNLSRHSAYKAKLFLGLTAQQLRRLRVTPLSRLPAMASGRGLVGCAFSDDEWLWRELLTETRPEFKRQLLLMVLQPRVPEGWTMKRPTRRTMIG
jgi:hypothetical protein